MKAENKVLDMWVTVLFLNSSFTLSSQTSKRGSVISENKQNWWKIQRIKRLDSCSQGKCDIKCKERNHDEDFFLEDLDFKGIYFQI